MIATKASTGVQLCETAPAFIGIDPGVSGGIAVIEGTDVSLYAADKLTLRDKWVLINKYCSQDSAVIEKLPGFIPNRAEGKGSPGFHMQKLGQSFGEYVALLTAADVPFEEKMPQSWQKVFNLKREQGEAQSKWKNRLKAKAEKLFPKAGVTLATCDALLIALYCQKLKEGKV